MPSKTTVAIISVTLLAALAIFKGIDGALLASAFVLISGLGGYAAGKHRKS